MKSEKELWAYFKQGLEQVDVQLQRIETGSTSLGVFDVNALYSGTEIWIELKYARSSIRPEQKAWCVRRLQAGGRLWIISTGGNTLEIWRGADAVIHQTYPKRPNHVFPRPIQWHTLRDTLFGEKPWVKIAANSG